MNIWLGVKLMETNNNPSTVREFLSAFFQDENESINIRTFIAKDAPSEMKVSARKFETSISNLSKDTAIQSKLIELN